PERPPGRHRLRHPLQPLLHDRRTSAPRVHRLRPRLPWRRIVGAVGRTAERPAHVARGGASLHVVPRYRWVLRILDVRCAFEGRGYPAIDAEATFAVEDTRYPENDGPWRLALSSGEAKVSAVDDHHRRPISIGALSSIFSGYLRPADAVVLGILDADDPAVGALTAMLDGPDPWCPFFF